VEGEVGAGAVLGRSQFLVAAALAVVERLEEFMRAALIVGSERFFILYFDCILISNINSTLHALFFRQYYSAV